MADFARACALPIEYHQGVLGIGMLVYMLLRLAWLVLREVVVIAAILMALWVIAITLLD